MRQRFDRSTMPMHRARFEPLHAVVAELRKKADGRKEAQSCREPARHEVATRHELD
jgi:hypothetical protein